MRERARLPADVQEDKITLWRQRKSRPNGRAPHPKGQAGIQCSYSFLLCFASVGQYFMSGNH